MSFSNSFVPGFVCISEGKKNTNVQVQRTVSEDKIGRAIDTTMELTFCTTSTKAYRFICRREKGIGFQ
jgi:hypothetical protein